MVRHRQEGPQEPGSDLRFIVARRAQQRRRHRRLGTRPARRHGRFRQDPLQQRGALRRHGEGSQGRRSGGPRSRAADDPGVRGRIHPARLRPRSYRVPLGQSLRRPGQCGRDRRFVHPGTAVARHHASGNSHSLHPLRSLGQSHAGCLRQAHDLRAVRGAHGGVAGIDQEAGQRRHIASFAANPDHSRPACSSHSWWGN